MTARALRLGRAAGAVVAQEASNHYRRDMTVPAPANPATVPAKRVAVLDLVALGLTVFGLLVAGMVVLISVIPGFNAILWLMLALIPIIVMLSIVGLVLGVIALVLAIRRRRSVLVPVIAIVLPAVVIVIGVGLTNGWFSN